MSASITTKEAVERQQCLDSLDEFIVTCQEKIMNMLDTLGWTPDHFMQPRNQCVCPFDSNHHVPKSSFDSHKTKCSIVSQGYSKEEAERILEDTSYYYVDSPCVYQVKLDLETLNSVLWNHHVQNHSVFYGYKKLPLLPEEEQQLMSREDRLGLAEYIIKRGKEANRLKELGKDELLVSENLADLIKKDTEERKLDPFEEMAALRDLRRRRQTYRAKNVHITKKSHTEIMREVINNQMEMFSQSLREESDQPSNENLEDRVEGQSLPMETVSRQGRSDTSYRENRSQHDSERKRFRSRSSSRSRSYKKPNRRSRSRSEERESHSGYRSQDHHTSKSRHSSRYRSCSRSREESGRSKRRDGNRDKSRSRSDSPERSKKSKHKKHKHKHKKGKKSKKKSRNEDDSEDSNENDSREQSVIDVHA